MKILIVAACALVVGIALGIVFSAATIRHLRSRVKELRANVVAIAGSFIGCKESDGSHKKIIDLYNSHKPLARGYPVKYTDAWCSTFASAVAIRPG